MLVAVALSRRVINSLLTRDRSVTKLSSNTTLMLMLIVSVNALPAQDFSTDHTVPSAVNRTGATLVGARGSYVHVQMFGGEGLGYSDAFTNLGGFVPIAIGDEQLVFLDSQILITNDGRLGSNLGLGMRHFSRGEPRVWGASIWYDFDNELEVASHQLGASLESYGTFDIRLSSYGPLQSSPVVTASSLVTAIDSTGLSLSHLTHNVTAMFNLEAEAGGPVPGLEDRLRLYIGTYYLAAKEGPHAVGVQGRLEGYLTSNMSVHTVVRQDDIFDTTALVGMTFRIGQRRGGGNFDSLTLRRHERVRRNYRISKFSSIAFEDVVPTNNVNRLSNSASQGTPNAELAVADFSLLDVNPTSPTFGTMVSPSDFAGQVSAYYFFHST